MGIERRRAVSGWRKIATAGLDYGLGAALLVVAAPVMAVIVVAIKLDSPGPALFRQQRHGYKLSVFRMIKFRTMTVMEDGDDAKPIVLNDPRVTRVGRFLRWTGLDELPQLVNVLKGEMSLVGPRPHPVAYRERYRPTVARYDERHGVKPGITGWAQVNGYRGSADLADTMSARVDHDLFYFENWSLLLDVKILLMTAWVLLRTLVVLPADDVRRQSAE